MASHPPSSPSQVIASVPRPVAFSFSADSAKIVHLVRHGQGYHNVQAALLGAAAYKDATLTDARLDETGKSQATALGLRMRERRTPVDVVLVSPLTRTLETASLMFPDSVAAGKSKSSGSGGGAGGAPPPPTSSAPPFVAIEWCREAFGGHPCDQRRPVSVVSKEFPHVDFSEVHTDADTWHNPDRRETVREVSIRCDHMLAVIRSRPERNIIIVSHGVFLETLLNKSALLCGDESIKYRRFENCECRSIVIGGWS